MGRHDGLSEVHRRVPLADAGIGVGGQVKNRIVVLNHLRQPTLDEVDLSDLDLLPHVLQEFPPPRGEVVDDGDLATQTDQGLSQVAPDEPPAAGQQNPPTVYLRESRPPKASTSWDAARPRWEILFFSSTDISAKVR